MSTLGYFDRERILEDLEQLTELVERKQWLWEQATDPAYKDQIAAEMAQHTDRMTQLKALLTP